MCDIALGRARMPQPRNASNSFLMSQGDCDPVLASVCAIKLGSPGCTVLSVRGGDARIEARRHPRTLEFAPNGLHEAP